MKSQFWLAYEIQRIYCGCMSLSRAKGHLFEDNRNEGDPPSPLSGSRKKSLSSLCSLDVKVVNRAINGGFHWETLT